jgi:hypothetical protein
MQVSTVIYQMGGKTVADGMNPIVLAVKTQLYQRLLNQPLYASYADRTTYPLLNKYSFGLYMM